MTKNFVAETQKSHLRTETTRNNNKLYGCYGPSPSLLCLFCGFCALYQLSYFKYQEARTKTCPEMTDELGLLDLILKHCTICDSHFSCGCFLFAPIMSTSSFCKGSQTKITNQKPLWTTRPLSSCKISHLPMHPWVSILTHTHRFPFLFPCHSVRYSRLGRTLGKLHFYWGPGAQRAPGGGRESSESLGQKRFLRGAMDRKKRRNYRWEVWGGYSWEMDMMNFRTASEF